ncbi:MAG: FHA domain-containing protein [Planctomycetota bacterium]|jgi:hypothetical protein
MQFHPTLRAFLEMCKGIPQERFLKAFPAPLLLLDLKGGLPAPPDFFSYARTSTADRDTLGFQAKEKETPLDVYVASLVKSKRNKFYDKITVGRAATNDVVIPHKSVSKLHAFFQKSRSTGELEVWDAQSRFGTEVEGKTIPTGESVPMRSGMNILIARCIQATFFSPKDLYTYMHLVAHQMKHGKGAPAPPQ